MENSAMARLRDILGDTDPNRYFWQMNIPFNIFDKVCISKCEKITEPDDAKVV